MSVNDRLAALAPGQRALFEALRQKQRQAAPAPFAPPPVERVSGPGGVGDWPLTFDQERLWFLQVLDPASTASNMVTAIRLRGALDPARLAAAANAAVRRHGAWRTTFPMVTGRPVQRVAPEVRLPLPMADLSALPDAHREGVALALASEAVRRPFSLENGPLARLLLVRLSAREHLCVLTVHHIVSDLISLEIFWREVALLHAGVHLTEPPVQFADFAVWQRRWLGGETLAAELDGWRERLQGFPLVLDLPTDRPRPAVQSGRGGRRPVRLDPAAAEGLRALARREGVTRFMAVAALSAALFHRLSGQERLITGTLNANRSRPEVESLIGFFLTQLPLAIDLEGDPPFRELLARVRAVAVAAFAHQHLPFGKLVEALQPERDTSRMPVVQALVQLVEIHGGGSEVPGEVEIEGLEIYDGNARYDLMLVLFEREDAIGGPLEYNADLFDPATAARMAEGIAALLAAVSADPGLRLSDLPVLGAAARHQVQVEWNDTARPEPPRPFLELFARQVARAPEAVACAGEGWRLSYAELDARSSRLARHLRRRGIGRGDLVALCLERGAGLPAALLGVLKSGAAYLPLDPAHPAERLALVLEDARAGLVLTQERLDAAAAEIDREAADPLPPFAGLDDRAYVIYTSGSTGRPKGVEVLHRGLANYLASMAARPGLGAGDVMMAVATVSFDISVTELFLPLAVGARMELVSRETAGDGALLAAALAAVGATCLQVTPATWTLLLDAGWPGRPGLVAMCGGEALPRALAGRLLPRVAALWNLYGPTETTVWSTAWQVEPEGTISIGRPIAETRVHLLDRRLAPVPLGAVGELCIGGLGVTRGYFRRSDLTAERFVPDPFAAGPGARLYRTGDLARLRPDGRLESLGRTDHQVKLRGFRIEPGEIEDALRHCPGVTQAAVLLREDRPGDRRLAAYLGLAPGAEPPSPAELRRALAGRLPDYMIPAAFVLLPSLPLNPNGKVDRKALAAIRPGGADGGPRVSPRTPAEELLAGIWSRVLEVPEVGAHDDFFALGGHSLLATQLVLRVRDAFGVEMPLRAVFQAPTLAAQAEHIARARGGEAPARPIPRASREGDLPPSFAQERLWFLDQLTPGSAAYNIPAAFILRGRLDTAALERAFAGVVRRHEALRTTFPPRGGRPLQAIAPLAAWTLPVIDLSEAPDPAAEASRQAAAEGLRPFDLARGPLLRARLLRLGPEEHVLVLTLHHVVADLWAVGVLVREVAALYAGDTLPELPVQYADFAVWQRGWLDGAELERQLDFWRRELSGAPPALDLATDRPRPPVESFRGASLPVGLGRELTAELAALGLQRGATPFMTLTAALALLLSRWSGQDDLVLGAPIANRQRPELEGLIGMFVNTLALRVRPGAASTFAELLAQVRRTALSAFEHQDLPFERLVEEVGTRRDISRHPLVQAVFAFQNVRLGRVEVPGLALEPVDLASATTKFDLTFSLWDGGEGLTGRLEYATSLFDAATIERLLGHLRNLLAGIAAAPEALLEDLPLLGEEERRQLLAWSGAEPVHPRESIPALFAEQAARRPDAVALVCGDEEVTYAELDRRARQVAGRLLRMGLPPESRIAVPAERSIDLLAALLGILQAGCAYLPLDPDLPEERRRFLLEDAGAISFDAVPDVPVVPAVPGVAVVPGVSPNQLAYVMYTSGSTGIPKGVAVTHGNVVRLVRGADWADLGPDQTFLQLANLSFDAATLEIWGPLLNGGRLVLFPGIRPSLDDLAGVIARHGVTTLWLTAGLFHQMVHERLEALRPLRQLLAGGDVLSPSHVRRALEGLPGCTIINGYGPTENTTFTACYPIEAEGWEATVPIGRPIRGTQVHVLDPSLWPVPVGVWGELLAGGDGVARGYLGRPDLTAERFVPDPWGEGGRLYRTGDVVRWRPAGLLEFLGRRDGQVKVRGFRIELGEIEAALIQQPGVRETVVLARSDGSLADRRLVAYVAAEATADHLRAALRERLPDYMIPAAFVVLERLPLTPNGKVDRRALEAIRPAGAPSGAPGVLPRTPVEELLAGIWSRVLEVPEVGADDDFFALGGHSLLATQLALRVREAFGVEIPLREIFQASTLTEQAEHIARARGGEAPASARSIPCASREGDLPLSFAQERLWFLDQLIPGSAVYNVPAAFVLHGRLDAAALERAFAGVVQRHEALRTTFPLREGQPVQAIAPPAGWALPVTDLSGLDGAREEAARLAAEEARQPFDLVRGPLLRALLLRLGSEEHVLALTLHHVVADLWAVGVLVREVAALYAGDTLPDLSVQYADFAVWQRGWLAGAELERQLDFWRRELAGAPPALELPTDRPRPPVESFRGASLPVDLGRELTAELVALGRQRGATPFMTLTAALALLLSRWSGQDDLVLGAPIANRQRPELEGLIGMFVNTLALRVRLGTASTFAELLAQVRRTALGAFEHQDLPFERLVEEVGTRRDLSRHPLAQAVFAFQNVRLGRVEVPGLTLEPVGSESTTTKFDLTFTLWEGRGDGLAGHVEYASDLFDAATVERLLGHLRNLLEGIVASPESLLEDLPLLGEEERLQLLAWSGAEPVHPRASIPALFAEQAARRPEAVAVVCGEEEVTYAELDRRARQVAGRLLRMGLPPESRIAVPAERSIDLIAALLGILQAGCAYLPLDPDLPEERRRFLLKDAGAISLDDVPAVSGVPAVPEVSPDQLAYVMYTSGSTGTPKGVAVTHGNVVRLVRGADWADLGPDQTFLQLANLAFDAATLEIWGPLLNGGRLVLFPGVRPSLDDLAGVIARHRVTTLWLTAGLFHQMVHERLEALRPLRQLLAGGDVLSPAHVRRALEGLPGCTIINGYGPTENTTFTACYPIQAEGWEATVPIGRPIRGTKVHVLDSSLRPVPAGVWGELFAGGHGVARGYLGRPDLTAERFVPDPAGEGSRLYRTGDVVRWRPDGLLEFLGRRDGQVKVRGFRIELGEIEAVLAAVSGAREAVVMVRSDRSDGSLTDRRLVAYVTGNATADGLRAALRERLPDYMIPAAFVVLERLPLTPNGKVDRRALPDPDLAAGRAREYLAPANPIEKSLAAACAEVLGLERVGMRDNFFDLGGHSLVAARLVSRLRDQYGLDVPLQRVFEAADLLDLSNRLVGQVLEEAGDLSLEDLQALLAGESSPLDGAV